MTKLEKMLKYVSEHNEFYKNRIKEYGIKDPLDITQWPVLTRKELQENRYNMFSDGYKSKYFNQQLRRQSSSGSSGMPVNVYWDYKDWYASNMSLWRKRLQWYGIHPNDKYVMFTLNAFNVTNDGETIYYIKEPANILSINVSLIQHDSGYDKLVDIINEFEPKWLYIQPFVLNKLIRAYRQTGKTPPKMLKYIESVGELLTSDIRRKAADFFNVPIANMYGSEEMNGIAYESFEHYMHILDDNVLIEVQNSKKIAQLGEGEAIITNLNNFGMPLIRYNQGDTIVISKSTSINAEGGRIIDLIKGRILPHIPLDNGREINSLLLFEMMGEINNQFRDIIFDYTFTYVKSDRLIICEILIDNRDANWFKSVQQSIIEDFKRKCKSEGIAILVIPMQDSNMSYSTKKIIKIME